MLFNEPGTTTMKYDNYSRRLTTRPVRATTIESRRPRAAARVRRRPQRTGTRTAVARAS
jgi:hypothetical protein